MTDMFKASPQTERLVDYLGQLADQDVGEVSYDDLNQVAGCNVQDEGYGFLSSARRRVQRERNDVWGCVRAQGLYLLGPGERARVHEGIAAAVRGKVRRGGKVMDTVDLTELSPEELDSYNVGRTRFLLIGRAASPQVVKRIEKAVAEDPHITEPLTLSSALDFLKKAQKKKRPPEIRPENDRPQDEDTPKVGDQ